MQKLLFVLLLFLSINKSDAQSSIYDYKITSASGKEIALKDFRGKIILVVNTASGSERNKQFLQLDSLCRSYAGIGLVVIAIPSDDFMHEPKTNNELKNIAAGFQPNFFIAEKSSVKGKSIAPFYKWCTQKQFNGSMDMEIRGDYQKILIDKTGKIIAVFSGSISPVDVNVLRVLNTY
jgi:glutathione peroxidase